VDEPLEHAMRRSLVLIDSEYVVRPIMDPRRATDFDEKRYQTKHKSESVLTGIPQTQMMQQIQHLLLTRYQTLSQSNVTRTSSRTR
jgi:hypothetical protein